MTLDQPLAIVELGPCDQRESELLDGGEGSHPEQLLLERADHSLGAAIALGHPHERRARLDAEERELRLERIADVLAAVIVAHREPGSDVFGDRAEAERRTPWRNGSKAS